MHQIYLAMTIRTRFYINAQDAISLSFYAPNAVSIPCKVAALNCQVHRQYFSGHYWHRVKQYRFIK